MSKIPVPDPVPTAGEDLILPADEFWEEHKVKIIGAIVAVLLLAIGGIGLIAWQREQSASARAAFAEASTPEEWRALMERYSGTPIAHNSGLLLAAALREAGDLAASSEVYQQLLDVRGPFALQSAAALGLAQNEILANNSPNASTTSALQAVATRFPNGYAAPYALYLEADLLMRQGQNEAAQQVFRNILTDYPNSIAGQLASMQLQRLAEEALNKAIQTPGNADEATAAATTTESGEASPASSPGGIENFPPPTAEANPADRQDSPTPPAETTATPAP